MIRSQSTIDEYGVNVRVLLRPDASIIVIQTSNSYLLTYSVNFSTQARVFQQHVDYSQARRQSLIRQYGVDESLGLREVSLRFRRAIRIDAGINAVLAVEDELIVATSKPSAVQCIRWTPDESGSHTSTELLSKMDWMNGKASIVSIVYDRAMNLSVWVTHDGRAFAVQRLKKQRLETSSLDEQVELLSTNAVNGRLFRGFCFHDPERSEFSAVKTAINARFSLLAISCANAEILVFAAKNYSGNVPLSHKMQMPGSMALTGKITHLTWSPDGYCLFAGFEKGWATWSVFGKQGASSFNVNRSMAETNNEKWLLGISNAAWTSGGSELLLTSWRDPRIWKLEMSRNAAVGCFSCANFVRALLQTPSELVIYRGHDMPDLTSISNEAPLWLHVQFPQSYLNNQWPIRACVISQDGRYVAVAGRRGLAHYSVQSNRWKTFSNFAAENSFTVRGGLTWVGHILIAATESEGSYELRLYSRDADLGHTSALHIEPLSSPAIFIGPSGEDSLLVYTYENVLYHYVVTLTPRGANLTPVGQIAFHGVVRAPTRVRSVSWILPESQLRTGDPSRDVEFATVLFLVDDKLVLLQPTRTPEGALKYDMRVVAQKVEYYILMRDQLSFNFSYPVDESLPPTPAPDAILNRAHHRLRDSLWTFGGDNLRMWSEVQDVLSDAPPTDASVPASDMLSIPVDFYPLSILLTKGIVLGIEAELIQRRDVNFVLIRSEIRTHLFLPYILRHRICSDGDIASALALASQYEHLSYFPHALEVLLYNVLDDEANQKMISKNGEAAAQSLLPALLSFLQTSLSPTAYLSTIVQCVRKTELSHWQTLFAHLPNPVALFEQALELDDLKTASGYLIVLHGFEEGQDELDTGMLEEYVLRLMGLARKQADFELCAELARFMIALDPKGGALQRVIDKVGFRRGEGTLEGAGKNFGLGLEILQTSRRTRLVGEGKGTVETESLTALPPTSAGSGDDYFSASPGEY